MSAIVTPDILARFVVTTLTFEDLAAQDGEELGVASNPYAVIGLTIKAVVKTNARRFAVRPFVSYILSDAYSGRRKTKCNLHL